MGPRGHRYFLHDFLADVATGHNLVATVFIECHSMYRAAGPAEMRPVGETEFVAGQAAMSDSGLYGPARVAAGIVGFADLTLGDRVEPVLEAHLRAAGGASAGCATRRRGTRATSSATSRPPGGPTSTGARTSVRALARLTRLGLSLDAWVFHPQLGDVVDLARACPDAAHRPGPRGRPARLRPVRGQAGRGVRSWKAQLTELARSENVNLKLGGMMMRLAAFDYRTAPRPPSSAELAALWRPYIETCIELFGASRCLFESNFPVDKMGIGWAALWNALKRITAGASPAEKQAMFSGTARRVYRLP